MQHELKILPEHFEAWLCGEKSCELRKDDRWPAFNAGDTLHLSEWVSDRVEGDRYTGGSITVRVLGVLRAHDGLTPGYCLMSCEEVRA